MDDLPPSGPPREVFEANFEVVEVRTDGDRILYFGRPLVPPDQLVERVWPRFREAGYEVQFADAERVDPWAGRTNGGTTGPATAPGEAPDRDPGPERDPGVLSDDGQVGPPDAPRSPGSGSPAAAVPGTRSTHVLVAEPVDLGVDGIPWKNVALFVATILSTLYAGSLWYHIDIAADPLAAIHAWPFTVAVMGVLGVHELGHYAMSRYHEVDASLPYFIPLPVNPIGTMGALIRMKGRMPDRKALFDIGVAGPLAGLVATAAVTAVGLWLSPVPVPADLANDPSAVQIRLGFPPLMYLIAWATGQSLSYGQGLAIHPVVIGGWVGMFVTFLNMIPVGQLDGGHVLRAILGETQETVAALVPAVLFGLAAYLHLVDGVRLSAVSIWLVWGLFAVLLAFLGPAHPVNEESLGPGRIAVGAVAIVLGLLCFTPVPIAIVP